MDIGLNFFGPKRKMTDDFEGTLDQLVKDGFTCAELCIFFPEQGKKPEEGILKRIGGGIWPYSEVEERLAAVRSRGMKAISAHIMTDSIPTPEQLQKLIPVVKECGVRNQLQYLVISLVKNCKEMEAYIPVLRQMSEELEEAGLKLAYHNHETECMPEEGTTSLEYLLEQCPKLRLELDVGWVTFAGSNALDYLKKYRERIELLHFKDVRADASPETRETCYTAVGEGCIPLKEILEEIKNCPIAEYGMFVDQDDSQTDIMEELARGINNIKALSR